MYEAAASCKDIAWTPENKLGTPQCNARRNAVRHGMKVQLVTPYPVSHSNVRRYGTR